MKHNSGDRDLDAARLWAGLSHDLRQPIQSSLLLMHVAARTQDPDLLGRTLGVMEHALLQMQEMVEAIGLLSRLIAGTATPRQQTLVFSDLIAEVEAAIAAPLVDRKVQLLVRGGDALIEGDRGLLALVLRGFVTMAVLASANGEIKITGRRTGGRTIITCAYHGEPISQGMRQAYFREMPLRAGELPSGGIVPGLAFIEQLASAMGWDVSTSSGAKGTHSLILSQDIGIIASRKRSDS